VVDKNKIGYAPFSMGEVLAIYKRKEEAEFLMINFFLTNMMYKKAKLIKVKITEIN